jgi:creatinine amidohydrolase
MPIIYENLTWPEVAELPRHLPMILPLGEGYSESQFAEALETEDYILLPALPYGWEGSLVNVGEAMLRQVVAGIFSAPNDEGFTNLIAVHGGKENLHMLGVHHMKLAPENSPKQTALTASPQRVILIPCGHTEQHGYHLPMNTDTVIIGAINTGTAAAIPDKTEMLPTLPYGVSTHRDEFAGTFNMGGRVFEDFILAVVAEFVKQGADRFYLTSGHGGNGSFLVNIVKYAGERHKGIFAATTFLHTSGRIAYPVVQQIRDSKRGGMGHAGELETAYLLHLRPELCKMERVVDEIDFISTADYYMDWVEGGGLAANPPWGDDTATGAYGAGSLGTAAKGEAWLAAAIEEKVAHVLEIHEQQDRRLAKRALIRNQTTPQ